MVWHNLLWPPATHTPFWVCCSVKYGTSTLYSLFPTREYVQPHGFCHTKYTCVGDGSHHVCSMLYTPIINIYLQRKYLSPILLEEDALRQEKLKNTMIDYDHEICTLFSAFSCSHSCGDGGSLCKNVSEFFFSPLPHTVERLCDCHHTSSLFLFFPSLLHYSGVCMQHCPSWHNGPFFPQ